MLNVEKSRRTAAFEADCEKQAQAGDTLAPTKRAPKLGKVICGQITAHEDMRQLNNLKTAFKYVAKKREEKHEQVYLQYF